MLSLTPAKYVAIYNLYTSDHPVQEHHPNISTKNTIQHHCSVKEYICQDHNCQAYSFQTLSQTMPSLLLLLW